MNKKLLLALAILLAVTVCCFAACKDSSVLQMYQGVKDANNVVQKITIKNGDAILVEETLTYNFASGKLTIERKTLNDSSAEEAFTTTTETKDISRGDGIAKLDASTLSAVTDNGSSLRGTVVNNKLQTAFGIESAKVNGDAAVEMLAQDGNVIKLTVNYTSSNGNAVTIETTYAY